MYASSVLELFQAVQFVFIAFLSIKGWLKKNTR